MAKKKRTTSTRRRRSSARPGRRSSRRGAVQKFGFGDLLLGVAGAFAVAKFGDKVPVQDPRAKAAILAGVAGFAAMKAPKEYRPLFVGAATYAGLVGINALMAQASSGGGGATDGTGDGGTTVQGMGRLSASRGADLRRAVASGLRARVVNASMNGTISGRINGTIGGVGRGSIFNR